MSKQCVKCGHVREQSDTTPDHICPKCGVIYAKAEEALANALPQSVSPIAASAKLKFSQIGNKIENPMVAQVLNLLSLLALLGGFVLAVVLKPGDPGDGYSWKAVAYLPSIIAVTAGIVQFSIFAALSKIVIYLCQIEFNTRQNS